MFTSTRRVICICRRVNIGVRTLTQSQGLWQEQLNNIAAQAVKQGRSGKVSSLIAESDTEVIDFANRKKSLVTSGRTLYPLLDNVPGSSKTMRLTEFRRQWEDELEPIQVNDPVTVQGRAIKIRQVGKGLIFIDIMQDFTKLQIVVNKSRTGLDQQAFEHEHSFLRRGDIISATGIPGRTKAGELSLLAQSKLTLLAPCLHPLPLKLENPTTRSHNRVVDLAVNKDSRDTLIMRSLIMSYFRDFFTRKGFIEVQTPLLSAHVGGASSRPFITKALALGSEDTAKNELSLRIAPELWLKRLVVAGFDKVFEIGPCFRNEGIDSTHNPEFTTCEFYQSYTTLDELMNLTQQLLRGLISHVMTVDLQFTETLSALTSLFRSDFARLDFFETIAKTSGHPLPPNVSDVEALLSYYDLVGLKRPNHITSAPKLLDKLASIYIEPLCDRPTFVLNHPKEMAALSKSHDVVDSYGIPRTVSRRFELFIAGKEYANAYEEENSPYEQKDKFMSQLRDREVYEDDESQVPDDSYVTALEWGLPPTGGWGMGLDRLCMLLTGSKRIEQVLSFGDVRTTSYQ